MSIRLIERFNPPEGDTISELETALWEGRPIIDLIPLGVQESNVTVQVVRNGREIDDLTIKSEKIKDGDTVVLRVVPKAEYVVLTWLLETILVSAIGVGIGYALNALINAIVGPPKKRRDDTEESATYDFDTARNTTQNGTPINIAYGEIRVAGHVLQARTQVLADGRVAFSGLYGLGHGGESQWESICGFTTDQDNVVPPDSLEINDNPASTYTDVTLSTRLGSAHQSLIAGFDDLVVLTVPLESALTFNNAFTYTGTNRVDAIELKIKFTQGLFSLSSSGNIRPKAVQFEVRWRVVGGTYNSPNVLTETKATRQPFSFSYRIENLNRAVYQVEVKRITADDADTKNFSVTQINEFSEIINDDLTYPGIALAGVKALATDQLHGSQPNVTFLCRCTKVRVYTNPTTFTYQWTRNPSWIILDLMINKIYGLGRIINVADVLIQDFIDFAAVCNEQVDNGGGILENRYECDIVIDTRRDAWDWIYDIAQSCQASLYISGGFYRIKAEKAATPVMMFTPGNVSSLKFGYTGVAERNNYVEISFPDRTLNFQQDMIVALDENVDDPEEYIKETLELLPITRRSQAMRLGNFRVRANRDLTRYCIIEADIPAIRCEPNDVVEVPFADASWTLYSGLVVSGTLNSVEVDREIIIEGGKTYKVRVWHTDGTFEDKVIAATPGTYTNLGVSGAFGTTPVRHRPYAIAELFYVFKQFRVVDMRIDKDFRCRLTCLEFKTSVFSDSILNTPPQQRTLGFSPLEAPPDVTDLTVKERIFENPDGTHQVALDVSFNPPLSYIFSHVDVWVRPQSTTQWPDVPAVANIRGTYARVLGNFEVDDAIRVAVTTASTFGARKHPSLAPFVDLTLTGKTELPSDVTGFSATRYIDLIQFTWNANPETDIVGYMIKQGTDWESGILVGEAGKVTQFETNLFFAFNVTYTATFLIKAKNAAGNFSNAAASLNFTIDPRVDHNVVVSKNYRSLDWPGTLTNFVRNGGAGTFIGVDNTSSIATYETDEVDLGANVRVLTSVFLKQNQLDLGLTWADATFTWASATAQNRTWAGLLGASKVSSVIKWRKGTSTPLTGVSYVVFVANESQFRYAQFKLETTILEATFDAEIEEFNALFDVPDIVESQYNVQVSSGSVNLTYTKVFTNVNSIAKQILIKDHDGSNQTVSGEYAIVTSETVTGCTVTIYDATNTQLTGAGSTRRIDFIAKGY